MGPRTVYDCAGWLGTAAGWCAADRCGYFPDDRYANLGFRLARTP